MTVVRTEVFLVLFGALVVIGFVLSFQIAALLGALSVIALGIRARRATRPCPQCEATIRGSDRVCERCGYES